MTFTNRIITIKELAAQVDVNDPVSILMGAAIICVPAGWVGYEHPLFKNPTRFLNTLVRNFNKFSNPEFDWNFDDCTQQRLDEYQRLVTVRRVSSTSQHVLAGEMRNIGNTSGNIA